MSRALRRNDGVTVACLSAIQRCNLSVRELQMSEHKHGEMDVEHHHETFGKFMGWTKWTVIVLLVLLVLMAIFIT